MDANNVIALITMLIIFPALVRESASEEINFSSGCSGQSCSSLDTYRPPSSSSNITMIFSPGIHRISSTHRIQRKGFIELKPSTTDLKTVVLCTSQRYGSNIHISYTADVKISGLIFSGCNIQFSRVNKTVIQNTEFVNGRNGAIEFSYSFNVTIDKSTFNNNTDSSFGTVVDFSSTSGIKITRTNFTNNHVSSFSGVIGSTRSAGYIGCSNFHNNSANSFGGIITLDSGSSLSITNSVFDNNIVSSFGGIVHLDSAGDESIITNSVFLNSQAGSFSGVIKLDHRESAVTVMGSKFIKNDLHYIGSTLYSRYNAYAVFYCSEFINSSVPTAYARNNTNTCKKYGAEERATCANTACELSDCRPPTAEVSLEQSEYTVDEGIGKLNRALQVCAVATDLLFGLKLNLKIKNGSATENSDFRMDKSDCRAFKFIRKGGRQKECTSIRILEDSVEEGTEQFSISLSSVSPHASFIIQRATISIVESAETTPAPTGKPTIPVVTTSGPFKTATVECGPLRRLVYFTSGGNDHRNLISAIVQSFGDLTKLQISHIAVLQIKSKQHGDYLDVLSPTAAIDDYSMVKVVTYDGFSCTPKTT